MNHTMTLREKILLVVLGVLILIVCYIQFFQKPINEAITKDNSQIASISTNTAVETVKASKLNEMKKEIAAHSANSTNSSSKIPEYNNLENVMSHLSAIMGPAIKYDMTFNDISVKDTMVYRPIDIQFTCDKYSTAKAIIDNLGKCPYRNTIDSIDMSVAQKVDDSNITTQKINVKVRVTFYEINKSGKSIK